MLPFSTKHDLSIEKFALTYFKATLLRVNTERDFYFNFSHSLSENYHKAKTKILPCLPRSNGSLNIKF